MAVLTQPLKRNTNTVVTGWFDSFSEGAIKEFRLPTNDDDRLALKNESAHYSVSARIGLTYVGGYRSDDLVNRAPYPSEASEQPEPMSSPQYLFDSRPRL